MEHEDEYRFNGFSPEMTGFLGELRENNNKEWFEAHRVEYQQYVLEPLRNLVEDLSEFMLNIDPAFETSPVINKTISRIYRDTRFSKDKSPYRSNMWIVFKRPRKDWASAPGYFFEIFPEWHRYGMGFYEASRATMANFRDAIDRDPVGFREMVTPITELDRFEIAGDKYKRIFDPEKSTDIQEWYQKKNLYLVHNRDNDNRLYGRSIFDDLIAGFSLLAPVYHFLWSIRAES